MRTRGKKHPLARTYHLKLWPARVAMEHPSLDAPPASASTTSRGPTLRVYLDHHHCGVTRCVVGPAVPPEGYSEASMQRTEVNGLMLEPVGVTTVIEEGINSQRSCDDDASLLRWLGC